MQFTSREVKLIERLRKEERRWPWVRWVMLTIGAVCTLNGGLWGWLLYHSLYWESLIPVAKRDPLDATKVFVIVVLWSVCCIWLFLAIWGFTIVWRTWNGDVNRMLLLKLLDAQQTREKSSDQAA